MRGWVSTRVLGEQGEGLREEDFAEHVVKADQLEVGGEIGVDSVLAEELVVFDMVSLPSCPPSTNGSM